MDASDERFCYQNSSEIDDSIDETDPDVIDIDGESEDFNPGETEYEEPDDGKKTA